MLSTARFVPERTARSVLPEPTLEVRMRAEAAAIPILPVLAATGTAAATTGILPASPRRDTLTAAGGGASKVAASCQALPAATPAQRPGAGGGPLAVTGH